MTVNDHTVGNLRDLFWTPFGDRPGGISCDYYDKMVAAKLREIIDAARYTLEVLNETPMATFDPGPLSECRQRLMDAVGVLPHFPSE